MILNKFHKLVVVDQLFVGCFFDWQVQLRYFSLPVLLGEFLELILKGWTLLHKDDGLPDDVFRGLAIQRWELVHGSNKFITDNSKLSL